MICPLKTLINLIALLNKSKVETLDENAKKHWKHKPYKCDFGGAKDETL